MVQGKVRVIYQCQNQELFYYFPVAYHLVKNILQQASILLWSFFLC